MNKPYVFSTTNYWDSPIVHTIIRNYLTEQKISEAGIGWILEDIAPRLAAISGQFSVEIPEGASETAEHFVSALHKMTSRTLVEILKLEIELFRSIRNASLESTRV